MCFICWSHLALGEGEGHEAAAGTSSVCIAGLYSLMANVAIGFMERKRD